MQRSYISSMVLAMLGSMQSCSPASTNTERTHNTPANGNIMDTSTWDFGDAPIEDNHAILKTEQLKDQYAIVIGTFTGDASISAAENMRIQLVMQYPVLGGQVAVRPRSRGSVLTYGDYEGYNDSRAKTDITKLRSMRTQNGNTLFAQVLLMRFKSLKTRQQLHPYDLWTIRREFPTMVPIFTLEVAVWGDFDSGQFPEERRRMAAEAYATELRKKGFEAFFYHNDDAELSSVTVGLFGHTAVDAETGFYSAEVEAMLSRFQKRLVNGEEVRVYFNPMKPELGSNVQPPCLAEVPID